MALVEKNIAPVLVDLGNCEDIHTSGIAKMDFLSPHSVRLVCHVLDDEGAIQRVVAKCIWEVDDLWDASVKVQEVLLARGYRRRMSRAN